MTSATSSAVTSRPMLVPRASCAASSAPTCPARGPVGQPLRQRLGHRRAGVHHRDVDARRPSSSARFLVIAATATLRTDPTSDPDSRAFSPLMLMIRPQPCGDHVRRHRPGAAQVAQHLGLQLDPQRVVGEVGQRRHRARAGRPGGGVDQDVHPAPGAGDRGDHRPHRVVVPGVRRVHQRARRRAPGRPPRSPPGRPGPAPRARPGRPPAARPSAAARPMPAAGAGHDGPSAGQLEVHVVLSSCWRQVAHQDQRAGHQRAALG